MRFSTNTPLRSLATLLLLLPVAPGTESRNPAPWSAAGEVPCAQRSGPVRVVDSSLVDDDGPFLGLGVSYFTALWRAKHDRARLEDDLAFLSKCGFRSYRMLSMVGYHASWKGKEIAPISFTTRDGRRIEAWPDYWDQLRALIDEGSDRHGLRAQITVFADADLMPNPQQRRAHLERLIRDVVRGRESKILLIEIANEAWQNGFPGDDGVRELRDLASLANSLTEVPIAISSNQGGPGAEVSDLAAFDRTYQNSGADLATWHFSRDKSPDWGWKPVYDCWAYGTRPDCPPAVSNEPIGPGASVATEREPSRLVAAAAFAFAAKLPLYVFHSEAGVYGQSRFEDTPGIDRFHAFVRVLPPDLPSWQRSDGRGATDPFRVLASGEYDAFRSASRSPEDGCVRIAIDTKKEHFVAVPIGIPANGLEVEARYALQINAFDPQSGEQVDSVKLDAGQRHRFRGGPESLIIQGQVEGP